MLMMQRFKHQLMLPSLSHVPLLHFNFKPNCFSSSCSQISPWSGLQSWRESPLNHDRKWGPHGPQPEPESHCDTPFGKASTLSELGSIVLSTSDPLAKANLSHLAYSMWRHHNLPIGETKPPPRPARPDKPRLVSPKEIPAPKNSGKKKQAERRNYHGKNMPRSPQERQKPSEKLDAIVQIIKRRNSALSHHDDEIEVDIDSVDAETLWELDRFVTNYKKSLSKHKRKAELALQARTQAEQNAPQKNQAPAVVELMKETRADERNVPLQGEIQVNNGSKSSSSSGSSSGSGPSSSDSDSDSSSASGSDAG